MPHKATIVIRCYNEEDNIGQLLHGILQQTVRDVEIIVVDSGSTDATLSIASRFPVKIINIKPQDFSFGHSLNAGCRAANSEFIINASAHVYPVYKNWVKCLLAPLADPEVALVYGKQRGYKNSQFSEHQIFAKWFPDKSNPNQDHPFCNNANASIRHEIWKQLPYNEDLTGLEDIDWAQRAMALGLRIVYDANAEVEHVHNETPLQIYNRYRREAIALKRILPNEHFHFGDFIYLFLTNVLSDYVDALHKALFWQNWERIPRFRLMQFLGTYRGFTQRGLLTSRIKQTFYYPNQNRRQKKSVQPQKSQEMLVDYQPWERSYHEDH
ncbi:MAG: glycosyltransferase family 2 protein [Deltaproteobacteria bacterium]|nr:glycosyltransferase family 2 protein [Deltaproteobacteria bacterium]